MSLRNIRDQTPSGSIPLPHFRDEETKTSDHSWPAAEVEPDPGLRPSASWSLWLRQLTGVSWAPLPQPPTIWSQECGGAKVGRGSREDTEAVSHLREGPRSPRANGNAMARIKDSASWGLFRAQWAQTALTKCCRPGGLTEIYFLSSGDWKFKIRVLGD